MKKITLALFMLSLILGFFFRSYQASERFMFGHDNDLSSWIFKDIVIDNHIRLIGQLTSSPGIFIGPFYYYLLIPFYLIANFDPIGTVISSWIIGLMGIASIYYTFNKTFGSKYAIIGSYIYAASWGIASNEREVVPTTPVMLWSVWFFYAINLLINGQKRGLIIIAILFSLIWHINLALVLVAPTVVFSIIFNRKMIAFKDLIKPILIFIILSLPLIIFETRHNFGQTRALLSTASTPGNLKILHVIEYAARNSTSLFAPYASISVYAIPAILLSALLFLPRYFIPIFGLWFISFILFFAKINLNLSEYYLNGLNIIWIFLATAAISKIKYFGIAILLFFILFNLNAFLTSKINHSGYIERKAIVSFIATDAKDHGYPCVSVSYITSPGNNLGYRYLFWLAKLHVNQPSSNSPVYSIVFPHSLVNSIDKSFGALGLVLPDYSKYNKQAVAESCAGPDSNLTDPMFGFTK